MLLLAGRARPKRIRSHDVYRTYNRHGEWSIRVEPGGLQLDNYHSRGGTPHLHPPGAYEKPVDLPGLEEERANRVVMFHLLGHGRIHIEALIQELSKP